MAFLMWFQLVDTADQDGFPGFRWAAYDQFLSLINCQVDIVQRVESRVPFTETGNAYKWFFGLGIWAAPSDWAELIVSALLAFDPWIW